LKSEPEFKEDLSDQKITDTDVKSQNITYFLQTAVKNDVKTFVVLTSSELLANNILCEIYKRKLYNDKYVWIYSGSDDYFSASESTHLHAPLHFSFPTLRKKKVAPFYSAISNK